MPIGPGAPNLSGLPGFSAVAGIAAGTQGGVATTTGVTAATQLTAYVNEINVSTTNAGVMLPPGTPGETVFVVNDTASVITVFGWCPQNAAGGLLTTYQDTIAPATTSTYVSSVTVVSSGTAIFACIIGESGNTQGGGYAAANGAQWRRIV